MDNTIHKKKRCEVNAFAFLIVLRQSTRCRLHFAFHKVGIYMLTIMLYFFAVFLFIKCLKII